MASNTVNDRAGEGALVDEDAVRRLARDESRRELKDVLTSLGINPDQPFEFQARMQFLAMAQAVWKTIVAQAITAAVGLVVVGIMWAVWLQSTGAPQ